MAREIINIKSYIQSNDELFATFQKRIHRGVSTSSTQGTQCKQPQFHSRYHQRRGVFIKKQEINKLIDLSRIEIQSLKQHWCPLQQCCIRKWEMIAAGFGCDLHYYNFIEASGEINDQLLAQSSKANLTQIPERSTVVSVKGFIHKDWQNKGLMSRYMYERAKHFVSKNYIDQFTLISNPYTLKISHKFGLVYGKIQPFNGTVIKYPLILSQEI